MTESDRLGVAPPARTPRWGIAAAALLGVAVLGFSARAVLFGAAESSPAGAGGGAGARPDARSRPAPKEPRFGADTKKRIEALRDRLVEGLLSLRLPDGSFSPPTPPENADEVEQVAKTDATAMAVAGLAAGRWMGCRTAGLDEAISKGKAAVLSKQTKNGEFGTPLRTNRAVTVAALSSATLAIALAGDPADSAALDEAAKAIVAETTIGAIQEPWSRGLSAVALLALQGTGHAKALGGSAATSMPVRDLPKVRDAGDARVVEAFVRRARHDPTDHDPYPGEILAKCVEAGARWGGDRTDMYSWCLRAWLASRTPGGDAWFVLVLPSLEQAPQPSGVVTGDFYGDPVSRTACALLILLEGWTPQLPFGG